jgi:rhodanese-related sulfurtransferase
MAVPRITREALKARLDAGEAPLLLDARLKYPYEHSTVRLPGAVRFAHGAGDLNLIPAGRDVVVYDSDPDEIVSGAVVAHLISRGVAASALAGGIGAWMAANFPVEPKHAPQAAPAAGPAKG